MAWQIEYKGGIWLPQAGWWLDAKFPVARCFVSHAHFDHMARHKEVVFSPGTAHLMRARMPTKPGLRLEHELPFGQTEQLTPDVTDQPLSCRPHLGVGAVPLGAPRPREASGPTRRFQYPAVPAAVSSPVRSRRRTLYQGDEPSENGSMQFLRPSRLSFAAIADFCRQALADQEIPVLLAYSLGKSQALLKGLEPFGLPIMLHAETARITRLYEGLGMRFPAYGGFDPLFAKGHIVIMSSQAARADMWGGQKIRTAAITGWALDSSARYQYRADAAYPLSDHAGFDDLLSFVDQVSPKRVLTLHGFAGDFARTLRARGIDAISLDGDNQLELGIADAGAR